MNIAVLGGGVEGRSVVSYFAARGAKITLCDKTPVSTAGLPFLETRFGDRYLENLEDFDLVFRSPGIPFLTPAIQRAIGNGAKITSATKYFFEKCPAKIIGITGTKGKGTTATVLYEILKKHSRPPQLFLGGNIGKSPLDFLDDVKKDDLVILELSSFQLQDLTQSPSVAVVLQIAEDHLDHHKSLEEYIGAKRNIVRYQKKSDTVIINVDSVNYFLDGIKTDSILKFSAGNIRGGGIFLADSAAPLMKIAEIPLIGVHNILNVLAAALCASHLDVPPDTIRETVKRLKPMPHRLEPLGEINGIYFYNDSASTSSHTAIAALRSFKAPLILIAGGSSKFISYDALGEEIIKCQNVKSVVLMGETRGAIEKAIDKASEKEGGKKLRANKSGHTPLASRRKFPLEVVKAENYQEAFMAAKLLAKPGDIVLLSPASASFDMFKNYQDRGERFKAFVESLR